MQTVTKVRLNGEVKYLTQGALDLAVGTEIHNGLKRPLEKIKQFQVLNACDLEDLLNE